MSPGNGVARHFPEQCTSIDVPSRPCHASSLPPAPPTQDATEPSPKVDLAEKRKCLFEASGVLHAPNFALSSKYTIELNVLSAFTDMLANFTHDEAICFVRIVCTARAHVCVCVRVCMHVCISGCWCVRCLLCMEVV